MFVSVATGAFIAALANLASITHFRAGLTCVGVIDVLLLVFAFFTVLLVET